MNWDFKTIEYFLKVAETLNFSQAARELFISTQAINRQIIQLEKQLGVKLLSRTTRSMRLTEAGQLFYDTFKPVDTAYKAGIATLREHLRNESNTIRIAFFQALPKADVVTQVASYLLYHSPSCDVAPEATELDGAIDLLRDGKADLGITNKHEYESWDDLELITLAQMPAQIVVSLNHPWVVKESITASDMATMPVLLLQRNHELEQASFYRTAPSLRRDYAPDFTSFLAKLDLAQHFAVFPRLFENVRWSKLHFIDLPPEFCFSFKMVCAYQKSNRFAPLFNDMREYFATAPLRLDF